MNPMFILQLDIKWNNEKTNKQKTKSYHIASSYSVDIWSTLFKKIKPFIGYSWNSYWNPVEYRINDIRIL